jgi:5-formyltetrahydrofolate cyclo-ligase
VTDAMRSAAEPKARQSVAAAVQPQDQIRAKPAARTVAIARRDALPADERTAAAEAIARADLPFSVTPGMVVSAFHPVGNELDILPLAARLAAAGAEIALPVVIAPRQPLQFRLWAPGDPLESGVRGIPVPPASSPQKTPDVLLVPLLFFDRQGYRLGYGAGFYDRTLAGLRATRVVLAVGVAFAAQEVPAVPHEAHDERLDWVLTEHGAFECAWEASA